MLKSLHVRIRIFAAFCCCVCSQHHPNFQTWQDARNLGQKRDRKSNKSRKKSPFLCSVGFVPSRVIHVRTLLYPTEKMQEKGNSFLLLQVAKFGIRFKTFANPTKTPIQKDPGNELT